MSRTPIWEEGFLEALLVKRGKVKPAAEFSGAPRSSVYARFKANRDFREKVEAIFDRLRRENTESVRAVLGIRRR